ncbi:hypothetical protein [Sporocytophaga myxococcoides]|nr:hypothetical protein [Sporocytophaga myxococcoides]
MTLVSFDSTQLTSQCGNGFYVDVKIESRPTLRKELEKYLYKALIDYEVCGQTPDSLYTKESFSKTILYVYDNEYFLNNSAYDDKSRWRESYVNLLKNCKSDSVLYKLTDSLLYRNIADGLIALWDKDITKLELLDSYAQKNNNNYYKLTLLAIIYHNNGLENKKNNVLQNLISFNRKETKELIELMNKEKKVDYFTYMETIFGGM